MPRSPWTELPGAYVFFLVLFWSWRSWLAWSHSRQSFHWSSCAQVVCRWETERVPPRLEHGAAPWQTPIRLPRRLWDASLPSTMQTSSPFPLVSVLVFGVWEGELCAA